MKKLLLFFTLTFVFAIGSLRAQDNPIQKPAPPTDLDHMELPHDDAMFPADVVDTIITDTSQMKDIRIDSTMELKHEDKKTESKKEDVIEPRKRKKSKK